MMTTPFVIERTFEAPVESVWDALTNKEKMKHWYFDLKEFKPVVGFTFEFDAGEEGKTFRHICVVTEAVINRKLAYTWRYEGYPGESKVTFELFAHGSTTTLRLTHEGLETFPAVADLSRENFEAGWNMIIGSNLKNYLEAGHHESH